MGKMTVYHGSYTAVKKPEILKGRNTKDFGPGFYCTVIREQFWSLPVLNIPPIRSTSAPRQLWPVWNTYRARR